MSEPSRWLYDEANSAPILERVKRLSNNFPRFRELYRDMIKDSPANAFTLKVTETTTDGTNYFWITPEPNDRLRDLMAAFEAGEVE